MSTSILYRVLEIPLVYRVSQWLLLPGADRLLAARWQRVFRDSRGVVIDVGCGPAPTTPEPEGTLVGVDVNPSYLEQFAGSISSDPSRLQTPQQLPRRMAYVSSAASLPFPSDCADEARAMGLLHHLPDDVARDCIREMLRCVRPGGRVIVFDNVWPRSRRRRPWAWLLRRLDRGEFVRSEQQLRTLLSAVAAWDWWGERFTYTYSGLEGMVFVIVKPEAPPAAAP